MEKLNIKQCNFVYETKLLKSVQRAFQRFPASVCAYRTILTLVQTMKDTDSLQNVKKGCGVTNFVLFTFLMVCAALMKIHDFPYVIQKVMQEML